MGLLSAMSCSELYPACTSKKICPASWSFSFSILKARSGSIHSQRQAAVVPNPWLPAFLSIFWQWTYSSGHGLLECVCICFFIPLVVFGCEVLLETLHPARSLSFQIFEAQYPGQNGVVGEQLEFLGLVPFTVNLAGIVKRHMTRNYRYVRFLSVIWVSGLATSADPAMCLLLLVRSPRKLLSSCLFLSSGQCYFASSYFR